MHQLLFTDVSTSLPALLFCFGFVAATVAGIFVCRPYSRRWIHGRRNANDMIGFSLQSFAALYGILLGLLAIEAYQDFSAVKDGVSKKALVIATMYHDADGLPKPVRDEVQSDLRAYADEILETLWPRQAPSTKVVGPSPRLHAMLARLLAFKAATKTEELVQSDAFKQINSLIELRRSLLSSRGSGIPGALWAVVALGAFLYILLMCLFDMELHVHVVLGATTALFLGAVVYLISALDNPFDGGIIVDPAPIEDLRAHLFQ